LLKYLIKARFKDVRTQTENPLKSGNNSRGFSKEGGELLPPIWISTTVT